MSESRPNTPVSCVIYSLIVRMEVTCSSRTSFILSVLQSVIFQKAKFFIAIAVSIKSYKLVFCIKGWECGAGKRADA
jgi:hypothetical protein